MSGLPWQYHSTLKRKYFWASQTDELVFENGQTVRRPATLPRAQLEDARYDGEGIDRIVSALQYKAEQETSSSGNRSENYSVTSQRDAASSQSSTSNVPRTPAYSISKRPEAGPSQSGSSDTYKTLSAYPAVGNQPPAIGALTNQMSGARITNALSQRDIAENARTLVRNPDNNKEIIARVNVTHGQGSAAGANTNITSAEVAALPTEKLYPEYKQRDKKFFFPGKVFSILWSEPSNSNNANPNTVVTQREEAIIVGPFGELIFSKIRRFVVIRQADGYCNAVPITTYNGKGVGKRGVTKSEHAIIYTNPLPKPLASEKAQRMEDPMRPIAIRMDPDTKADKLDPVSRINFGHPHTIQYNVKVKSCGKVAQESQSALLTQFAGVFTTSVGSAGASGGIGRGPSNRDSARSSARGSEDKIATTINALMENGMSKTDAIRRTLEALQEQGYSQEAAAELIRRALS